MIIYRERPQVIRRRAVLFNKLAAAWAGGTADWLFVEGRNVAVWRWTAVERAEGVEGADKALEALAALVKEARR